MSSPVPSGFVLYGLFDATLDNKGRLLLPTDLRGLPTKKLVLMHRPDHAIAAFPEQVYQQLLARHGASVAESDSFLLKRLLGGVHEAALDQAHRFFIPEIFRRWAGLDDSRHAVLLGTGNCIEIWEYSRYQAATEQQLTEAAVRAELERIGLKGLV